ncbi:MAG: hypothetical protein HPY66_0190 [Firmicutes bacterium]|nr:hypothetical protein [Bacillota bacterium]
MSIGDIPPTLDLGFREEVCPLALKAAVCPLVLKGGISLKKLNIRKIVGLVMIGAGVLITMFYVPSWVWFLVLGVLCVLFVFTLIRIYL